MGFLNTLLNALKNIFVPAVSRIGLAELNRIAVLFGKAFGPDGIKHFSELTFADQRILLERIPVLKKNHEDWPKPLQWVPRTATAYFGPRAPILDGNTTNPKPIPAHGEWFITRGYVACTSENGLYVRCGFRYDDVDGYYEFPSFKVAQL